MPPSLARAALDRLYRLSGALAAAFLAAIALIVVVQVAFNLIDRVATLAGLEPAGLLIPSYAEFAGYCLAASSFLALAYTLRAGGHIRVSLVIQHLSRRVRRAIDLWCSAVGALLAGYFAYFAYDLVLDSLHFGDVSPGIVPVPLWLPQLAMALGLTIVTIALVDEFVAIVRGGEGSKATEAAGETGRAD